MTSTPDTVLDHLPPGTRVVVRHRLPEDGRASDALGPLVRVERDRVTVRTRAGEVSIARAAVLVAKAVPEQVWRLASFLRRAGVAVLDLDGVLRGFDADGGRTRSEQELGLPELGMVDIAYGLPEARDMVVGRSTYARWLTALEARLLELGHPQDLVTAAVRRWEEDRGTPIRRTAALVDELLADGIPLFVLTNGTDRVPDELHRIGLGHLADRLLNTHDLGFAKPAPEAYAVAHAEIERRLGRRVGVAEVRFTDDRVDNVEAAREFGWRGQVFALPG